MTYLAENSGTDIEHHQTTTDWGILNCMSPMRLKRTLAKHSEYRTVDIQIACGLIFAYHQVYRKDLIQLRHQGYTGLCQPPTLEQLKRIAQLQNKDRITTPQQILVELQKLAQLLR